MAIFTRVRDLLPRLGWGAKRGEKKRSARFWWWGFVLSLGLYVFYVVGASAFVCLGGMTWVTQSEKDVRIDASGGYSLIPGRFHLSGLRVQFKDYNVEMAISADEADLSIALHRLVQKRIHLHWVRASGVEYRLHHRVHDPTKSAARLAAFPDIPAFDRPPYYDSPKPPLTGKKKWSLRVDSIEVEARLAWILEYQLRGKMRAKGAFYTDPAHEAAVLPCDVKVSDATISVGQEQIAHGAQGVLSFSLAPFEVRDAPIEKVLPKISAQVGDFSARIDTLSFTKLYFSTEPLRLEGQGQLEIDTTVTEGKIQKDSIVSLEMSLLIISAQGEGKDEKVHSARGRSQLSLQASSAGHMDVAVFAQFPAQKQNALSVERLEARAAILQRSNTAFEVRSVQVDMKALHYDRPEFLYALLGMSAAIPMSGTFHLHGEADLPKEGAAQLEAKLNMLSTSFFVEGERFGATAETTLSCRGSRQTAACGFDFHAPYLRLDRHADGQAEVIWLRLKAQRPIKVSTEEGTFQGPILVSGGDPRDVLSEWMGKAWLPQMGLKLVPTGMISGSLFVEQKPGELSLTDIDIETGKTRLEGQLTSGKTTRALGTIKMPTGRWGFEFTPDGLRVRPFIGRKWLAKQ